MAPAMSEANRAPDGDRRVSLRLREIFVEAYDVLEPFFESAPARAEDSREQQACHALQKRFSHLSREEVFIMVTAARRVFGAGGKPAV